MGQCAGCGACVDKYMQESSAKFVCLLFSRSPFVIVLLIFTLAQGTTIGGANASRWINIPFVGIGFQTSTLAGLVLMVYVARYLARNKEKVILFKESLWQLWLPVAAVLILILPANFSTTAIIFSMILVVVFIGVK